MFAVYPYLLVLDADYKHLETIARKLPRKPFRPKDNTVAIDLGSDIVTAQGRLDDIAYLLPSEVIVRDPQRVLLSVKLTSRADASRSQFWLQTDAKEVLESANA